jgi:hypothetical protein
MLSNIEQAVTSLLASNEAITVSNVFSAYMTIAGLRELDSDSIVATFERAMDKHALRPTDIQSPMIVKLRNQYWYTKLGGCRNSGGVCHKCGSCGGRKPQQQSRTVSAPAVTATQPSQAVEKSHEAAQEGETESSDFLPPSHHEPPSAKPKKRKRVCRKMAADPYAPSTSGVHF